MDELKTHRGEKPTSSHMRRDTVRFWALPAISALAAILIAATVETGRQLGPSACDADARTAEID